MPSDEVFEANLEVRIVDHSFGLEDGVWATEMPRSDDRETRELVSEKLREWIGGGDTNKSMGRGFRSRESKIGHQVTSV